jgi:homoserine O-succinyltransferase/O-acetyltransferase
MSSASFGSASEEMTRVPAAPEPLVIGLVNNMPDGALQKTEQQFRTLLGAAAGEDCEVRLRLFSFPELIRDEAGRSYVADHYEPIARLWRSALDGLIVTGAEPRTDVIPDEVYWPSFTRLVDWAIDSCTSTVWSCLAAHAAVLYLDGIVRCRFEQKLSGVFRCTRVADDPLVAGLPASWRMPHSRLNTLDAASLSGAGYRVLSRSEEAGVDAFVRRDSTTFVFFQGHPEYDTGALLREYRRDVGRFLAGTMDRYPEMPRGYFDEDSTDTLNDFRGRAEEERTRSLLAAFPEHRIGERLSQVWHDVAVRLYRNWLAAIVAERRTEAMPGSAATRGM